MAEEIFLVREVEWMLILSRVGRSERRTLVFSVFNAY